MSRNSQHWYTGEQMKVVLQQRLSHRDDVFVLDPIDAEKFEGETLRECIQARLLDFVLRESKDYQFPEKILAPINLGNRHWVALCIHFDTANKMRPRIDYYDSFGYGIHDDVLAALFLCFKQLDFDCVHDYRFKLQDDGYNCGPWTIVLLERFAKGLRSAGQVDISRARKVFDGIFEGYQKSQQQELKANKEKSKTTKKKGLRAKTKTKTKTTKKYSAQQPVKEDIEYHDDSSDEETDCYRFKFYDLQSSMARYEAKLESENTQERVFFDLLFNEFYEAVHYSVADKKNVGSKGAGFYYYQDQKSKTFFMVECFSEARKKHNLSTLIKSDKDTAERKRVSFFLGKSFAEANKPTFIRRSVKEFVKKFCEFTKSTTSEIRKKAHFLSINVMISHCIGDAIPHARKVSRDYYISKRSSRELSRQELKRSELKQLIKDAITTSLQEIVESKEEIKRFITQHKELIRNVAKTFVQNPLFWMREARRYAACDGRGYRFSPVFYAAILPVENCLQDYFTQIKNKRSLKTVQKPSLTPAVTRNSLKTFVVEQFVQVEGVAELIYGDHNLTFRSSGTVVKTVAKKIIKDEGSPEFIKKLCEKLKSSPNSEIYQRLIGNHVTQEVKECAHQFLYEEDKTLRENQNKYETPKKKLSGKGFSPVPPSPLAYIYSHQGALRKLPSKNSLIGYFREQLISHIVAKYHVKRPTLPVCHLFHNRGTVSSLSNSRLSNLSVKRRISNNEEGLDLQYNVTRWWEFLNTAISERLTLSRHGTREDYVDLPFVEQRLDSYENLASSLKEFIKQLNNKTTQGMQFTGRDVAAWIRQVHQNKQAPFYLHDDKGQATDKQYTIPNGFKAAFYSTLRSLEVLLLHNECARNRGSYVINQMFLDLVQFGRLSWDDINTSLPMAQKNAVSGSRYLTNVLFDKYLPFKFIYKGPEKFDNSKLIFLKEANLIEAWCEIKKIDVYETSNFIKQVHACIKTHWYPGIGQLATEILVSNSARLMGSPKQKVKKEQKPSNESSAPSFN